MSARTDMEEEVANFGEVATQVSKLYVPLGNDPLLGPVARFELAAALTRLRPLVKRNLDCCPCCDRRLT